MWIHDRRRGVLGGGVLYSLCNEWSSRLVVSKKAERAPIGGPSLTESLLNSSIILSCLHRNISASCQLSIQRLKGNNRLIMAEIANRQEEHEQIATSLEVEQLDTNLFRSKSLWLPIRAKGVFGGQVISQALVSATRCVDPVFSLHVSSRQIKSLDRLI